MRAEDRVSVDDVRARFAEAMSRMYRAEVPLYGDLLDIVADVNGRARSADDGGGVWAHDLARLDGERHGAIRLGTAEELATMRRVFAVMGMHPVGYYDLAPAGVPVHATAFRPIAADALARNPFRMFTSLLRLPLVRDDGLRAMAADLLASRRIFSDEAIALVAKFEADGGLDDADADRFVAAIIETFRWHEEALVDGETYRRLHDGHRLLADVVAFRGPHINHLTPRTLDIDAAQAEMLARGIDAKAVIEGPPRRHVPILLRQTSFKALEEPVRFRNGTRAGVTGHTARFGEIEQRGVALTERGRALYDDILAEAMAASCADGDRDICLSTAFRRFPDDLATLRQHGLAYFRYELLDPDRAAASRGGDDLDALIAADAVRVEPITYEDFLPVSAAGIFRSNLGDAAALTYAATDARASFEEALGAAVIDANELYRAIETESLAALRARLAEHGVACPAALSGCST